MTQSQPPITRTTHTLPFDKLSPRDFERLCLWLVEREGYERAEHLGAAGSEQGRDIIAWHEGALWAFQCKRVQRFGPKDALAEVEKVLALPEAEHPAGLVFLVTCDVSANTRQQARERCVGEMECHFWTGTELDEKVKQHTDIVEEFFADSQPRVETTVSATVSHVTDSTVITAGRDVIQKVTQFLGFGPDVQRAQRNRRAMLELVRNTWVKGVLEKSLHGAAMIELGLEERADAVERPWDMLLQMPEQPNRSLPRGTKMVDVFDDMNQALLILGEPGSGKTTMLLELARDTIARAEDDFTQPIPVVFNLSSWAEKRQPIVEWLVEEFNTKYNIPNRVARPWVENGDSLLLLDGLDEVKLEQRDACVRAINDFRQEYGLTPLVVCSRIADCEALTTRLKLQGAVLLQPLTPQQVDEYLKGVGSELLAVRESLRDDAVLQELAQSPLMLSIMTLAYQGMSVEDLGTLDSIEARRRHVLDAYVKQMFERRRTDKRYSPEETIYWLAWLARKMSQHAQTVFLIKWMQSSWLQTSAQRGLCAIISCLIVWLIFGLFGGLFGGLSGGLSGGLRLWCLVLALIVGLIFVPFDTNRVIAPVSILRWSRAKEAKVGLVAGLIIGLTVGLIGKLVLGLVFGLTVGLIGGLSDAEVKERTVSDRPRGHKKTRRRRRIDGQRDRARYMTMQTMMDSSNPAYKPVRVTRQLRKKALAIGLSLGLLGGLFVGPLCGLVIRLLDSPIIVLIIGLLCGQFGGQIIRLILSSFACIQHFTLRFILYRNGHTPWNYARFLDYAAERIFLRKVGGGYIFVHRLLQDYFASLYQSQ